MCRDLEAQEKDSERREAAVLKRLLATPPDHRTKPKPGASPKKRTEPAKDIREKE